MLNYPTNIQRQRNIQCTRQTQTTIFDLLRTVVPHLQLEQTGQRQRGLPNCFLLIQIDPQGSLQHFHRFHENQRELEVFPPLPKGLESQERHNACAIR